jgi:ribonuclease D
MAAVISRTAWPARRVYAELWSMDVRTKDREGVMRITVASTAEAVDDWAARVAGARVLGLDIEYRPNMQKGGRTNRTSLIQLAAGDEVLLVQMFALGSVPVGLASLLENASVLKTGVGIDGDVAKLKNDWSIEVKGAVDLSTVMMMHHDEPTYLSLAKLSVRLLGVDMCKDRRVVLSNWERRKLSQEQVLYAALDAWVGCECAGVLKL